ncbi:YdeI/OmpD-associated family protein [Lysobacter capsici]|uniref:YdeI/OmpD-associated family protein n=1 Tax=Lysobacter capsici TaxID=435897 RepID=UPI00287B854C|nr:YdeI/OmpD-associated family protein [Lysobacter capsici]WND82543.1 YdeI/OmpD-associated family protein [Lysobacter capsici]WND87739.1 YdeI/OmpD-associated family protein [Lysobacter capsici]
MSQTDPRIDAYIAQAAPFAQPILEHLRAVVHAACPQVEETIKWGMPSFVYGGKILCGMGAFKQHATFGFWQGASVVGASPERSREAMGQFGRLTKVGDLPGKRELSKLLKQAMVLIDARGKKTAGKPAANKTPAGRTATSDVPASKTRAPKPPVVIPDDLAAALKKNAKARATYAAFPVSQQREYVEWIESAKREQTRSSRVAQAVEWMAEGKIRNWKYVAKK